MPRLRDGPGFPGLNQEKWSEPAGTGFFRILKIPVFPGLNHFIWSGPQKSGPDRKCEIIGHPNPDSGLTCNRGRAPDEHANSSNWINAEKQLEKQRSPVIPSG